MTQLTILGTNIRQDAEGRYCLNDCHRASGGDASKAPGQWMANKQTKALMAEMDTVENSTVSETAGKSVVTIEGRNGGTYAAKEMVYAYAMWINPAFHLKVIRAFDAMVTGRVSSQPTPMNDDMIVARALQITTDKLKKLEQQVTILAPKAESFDALANLEGRHNLRSAAAQCGWPQNKFIDQLISLGWVYVNPVTGRKHAYSDRLKTGMMEVKNVEVKRAGYTEGVGQPMVTQKGLARLKMLLGVYQAAPSREMELH